MATARWWIAVGVLGLSGGTATAQTWVDVARDAFTALAVDRDSVAPSGVSIHTVEAQFRYRFATAVDCSPPRGCHASSRRSRFLVDCFGGTIAMLDAQFLDLNDNVIKATSYSAPLFAAPRDDVLRLAAAYVCREYRVRYPGEATTFPYRDEPFPVR